MLTLRFSQRLQLMFAAVMLAGGLSACAHPGASSALPSAPGQGSLTPSGMQHPLIPPSPAPGLTYQQLVALDLPTAYYQLADTSSQLVDSGPNNIAGTYGTAIVRNTAAITNYGTGAATFPGGGVYNAQGYAYAPKNTLFQSPTPTLEAWFSLNAGNATSRDIPIIFYGTNGRGARYGLFIHGLGGGQPVLQFQVRSVGLPPSISYSQRRLSLNTIYHAVVTFDGYRAAIFINGVLDSAVGYSGTVDYSPYFSDGLQIGGGNSAPAYGAASFPGTIAQAAVYPLPLRPLQIANHYLAGRFLHVLTETPADSDSFVDSIGMNAHFENGSSIYGQQFAQVSNLLVASGIRHVRVGITYEYTNYPNQMQQLAASGVHGSYVTNLNMTQAQVQAWPGIVGSSFEQYEAPNEQDDVNNPNWLPQCIAFQQNLYSWVKSDPQIASFPILGPSIVKMDDATALGNLSAYMDYGNIHSYFNVWNPGTFGYGNIHPPFGVYGSLQFNLNIGSTISGNKPIETTETGYGTVAGNPLTLDNYADLRYMTRLFFTQFNGGVKRSYSYEFMDEGGTAPFSNFGIVTTALQPKPAYTGIQSIINQLKDPGPAFKTTPLTFELLGFTDNIEHTLLQKRNGHYVLAVWQEVQDWVTVMNAGGDINVPPQTIKLHTATHLSSATITTMDEGGMMTTAPLTWGGQDASIPVSDKITLIDLAP